MTTTTLSFYDPATGLFTGRRRRGHRLSTEGLSVVEGAYDHLSQRVDLESGAVVDYQPPQPSPDHEWRENVVNGRPRWVKKAEVVERERRAVAAQQEIDVLERSKIRALTDHALAPDVEIEVGGRRMLPKDRVAELEAKISEKRNDLAKPVVAVLPRSE
jgi:hypothetical protein